MPLEQRIEAFPANQASAHYVSPTVKESAKPGLLLLLAENSFTQEALANQRPAQPISLKMVSAIMGCAFRVMLMAPMEFLTGLLLIRTIAFSRT